VCVFGGEAGAQLALAAVLVTRVFSKRKREKKEAASLKWCSVQIMELVA